MKNLKQTIFSFAILTITMVYTSTAAMSSITSSDEIEALFAKTDLVGVWEYNVANAPAGYENGLIMIVDQDGEYKVQVQIAASPFNGENVVLKGNKVTFTINVEGETVSVMLEAKGNKLTGTSTSPSNGELKITGVKSISPQ